MCVGIGPTKTLAKLANHMAKKHENFNGICDFNSMPKDLQNIRWNILMCLKFGG